MFDQIVATDPYRLDDLDVYSNILYVMEKSSKLAYLAQLATTTDKFRVETCCIVGPFPLPCLCLRVFCAECR